MKKLIAIVCSISLLLLTLLITTCRKEYSYEGGPQAVFVLEGSPGECTDFTVNGDYYTGISTDSTNSVAVNVSVTTTGNYNIASTTADGISFSASGTFTDTGFYTITLKAGGTPAAAGDYTFTIPGSTGCYFSLQVTDQPPANYTLDGAPNDCENPNLSGTYAALNRLSSDNKLTLNVVVQSVGDYHITTDTVDGVSFSASGKFTATGSQQVVLAGEGMPDFPGVYYMNVRADASACNFPLKVGSSQPFATYVLQSSNNGTYDVCTPHTVEGVYTAGTALDLSNTITITAYVTEPGNYTIATEAVNGVLFESSGNFTATGVVSVVLQGSGTPFTPGNYVYVPEIIGPAPLGGAACGVEVPVK